MHRARLHVALIWHQHQPLYRDLLAEPRGAHRAPWVRLHAARDYVAMPMLAAEHPEIRVTFNLTPVLLDQIQDQVQRGGTDRAFELSLRAPGELSEEEREEICSRFFDADWHNQIFVHRRYSELFEKRRAGVRFSNQELNDLQVWFSLAWFGKEVREGSVVLPTGERCSAQRFVEKARGFDQADVDAVLEEQMKLLRAVVPVHRELQRQGRIEVSTSPYCHPILPLLVDTDRATVDRPGACLPEPFRHPEDANAQLQMAVDSYRTSFGVSLKGSWPAEGAVAEFVVPFFLRHGIRWIASDRGVLARSGRWGYRADDPRVLGRPYRAESEGGSVAVFFRDTEFSDALGFHCQQDPDATRAARGWIGSLKDRFARDLSGTEDRVVTVVLDGENAWGSYRDDGRPFLRALYGALAADPEIVTVTPTEYLDGNLERGVRAHPLASLERVWDLFTGSWIDEIGSAPGVDLGTWIGEREENRAWKLLKDAREAIASVQTTSPEATSRALASLYAAEGSDWFWWFGEDQDSGGDESFDELFRLHLANAYRAAGLAPPAELSEPIVPRVVTWTFVSPVPVISSGDHLLIRTGCPGALLWSVDGGGVQRVSLTRAGGVIAGASFHQASLGPFDASVREINFAFQCEHPGCDCNGPCCEKRVHTVMRGTTMTKKNGNQTTLHIEAPTAKQIFVAGTFNGWKTDSLPMRCVKGGEWSIDLALPPGRYEYKFVVDGQWCCEISSNGIVETTENGVSNDFGTMNRVLEVRSTVS